MAEILITPPILKARKIPLAQLYLDPSNPRFLEFDEILEEDQDPTQDSVQEKTLAKMQRKSFAIKGLKKNILSVGWVPTDRLIVQKLKNKKYKVLEGNRRLTALKLLLRDACDLEEKDKLLSNGDTLEARWTELNVQEIEVSELITDGLSSDEVSDQINFLLGIRHHKSLKKWSPFAQANYIYKRYLEFAQQTDKSFSWKSEAGKEIAHALSEEEPRIKGRIKVYRVMQQIDSRIDLDIEGRSYSLCAELINRSGSGAMHKEFELSQENFQFDNDALDKIIELCGFKRPHRGINDEDPPAIKNKEEWKFFKKIIEEENDFEDTVKSMLERVYNGEHPSDVWGERQEELKTLSWDRWLKELHNMLIEVPLGALGHHNSNPETIKTVDSLYKLLQQLDAENQ